MATTICFHRVQGAPAPAVPPKVDRWAVLLLLGTVTASVTYTAGLSPPAWFWSNNGGGHLAGDPVLRIKLPQIQRYLVFVYCNVTAFVGPLAMILIFILPGNPVSRNQRIKLYALRVATMTLSLLSLAGAYVAGNCLSFVTSMGVVAFAAVMLLYIAIQFPLLLCKPVEISLGSVNESSQKCSKLLLLKKKKFLVKVEQENHMLLSGQAGSGEAYQILENSRMHMLLLGTLVAIVTYQAGLNQPGDIWQGEVLFASEGHWILEDKRYLAFFSCNASAFIVSLAILILLLISVFSTHGIKYYCALQVAISLELFCLFVANITVNLDLFCLIAAYVAVKLEWFCLIGAYVAGRICQLFERVYISMFVVWPPITVAIQVGVLLLQVLLCWVIWRQALREKTEQYLPDWLKKLFGLSTDGHEEEEDEGPGDDEEEEDEAAVAMGLNLEQRRKLLLLLAILIAILVYHASTNPPPDNLVNYRLLAFSYCKAVVFIASLSIIAMLATRKLPAARSIRWHAMRVCLILDVIGITGTFAARGYWKISKMDVLVVILAVLLCIAFHVALSIHATTTLRGGLVQGLLSNLRSPTLLAGPDPLQDDGSHEFEVGMTGGTNEEPLGVEIASPILGGALTLIVAIPVISIVAHPVKLLVGTMIASIGVGLWRRSLARLFRTLASGLQLGRQGTTQSTAGSSSGHPEHGLCKLIQTLCAETWMWIIILVIWVPSLRHSLKLKFKLSRIFTVLGVLLVNSAPTPNTTTPSATSTTTTATVDTPSTATPTTVVGTPTTAAASGTSSIGGGGVQPRVELRPRRNRRANSRLMGPDWVN
uniref:Uncharacterized protein n=1 Tax=Avena sativa TaxID=4498 RepID=A0ACD5UF23_AVESA